MKSLNGSELAEFIKERQAKQVRVLRQAHRIIPKFAIVQTIDDPVIDMYVGLKRRYGDDILVEVEVHKVAQEVAEETVSSLNADADIHGIIIQLPLADTTKTEELLNIVQPDKDVDGLAADSRFDPATPMAINWLLAGYNISLAQKKVVIVGHGRLVGAPLTRIWRASGVDVTVVDRTTEESAETIRHADIVVTAAGAPGLITSEMLRPDAVVIDAATASENGEIVGDVAADVRERQDLTITPIKGGVGPLTVCALFDNVIRAAQARVN